MSKKLFVEKADGTIEPFDGLKLQKSLINSEASLLLANEIVNYVEDKISSDKQMMTGEIYKLAFDKLKQTERKTASRYSLRRSLLGLGPTGFPFEKFISKILEKKGYQTRVGVIMEGQCVEHEIDVVACEDENLILFEIKFHNNLKIKTDTKVVLYVKARFDDLKNKKIDFFNKSLYPTNGSVITNTKFTDSAKKYAKCAGLELISWNYPDKGNLYDLIEETGLYPITTIVSLSKLDKERLIEKDIINCLDIKNNREILDNLGLPPEKILKIFEEVDEICQQRPIPVS